MRFDGRADTGISRDVDGAGAGEPVAQPNGGREPGTVRAHEGGGVSRWGADAARQDRYGSAQPEPARSGDVPHSARGASSNGREMVHLSDVRFHARRIGFDRAGYALDLYARVRRPPAALRLVP